MKRTAVLIQGPGVDPRAMVRIYQVLDGRTLPQWADFWREP